MEFLQSDLCAEGEAGLLGFQVSLTWVPPTESIVKTQVKTCLQVPWLEQSCGGKGGRKERKEEREGRREGDGRRRSHGVLAVLRVAPPASCSTKFAGNSTAHRRPRARWGGAGRGWRVAGRRAVVKLVLGDLSLHCGCRLRLPKQRGDPSFSVQTVVPEEPSRVRLAAVGPRPGAATCSQAASHASRARRAPAATARDPGPSGTHPPCASHPG